MKRKVVMYASVAIAITVLVIIAFLQGDNLFTQTEEVILETTRTVDSQTDFWRDLKKGNLVHITIRCLSGQVDTLWFSSTNIGSTHLLLEFDVVSGEYHVAIPADGTYQLTLIPDWQSATVYVQMAIAK